MAVGRDPATVVAKQIRRTVESEQDWVDGVNAVKEAPTKKAKAKKEKLKTNFMKAINDGKWEAGLDAWDLVSWQAVAVKKRANFSQGATDAYDKDLAFQQQWQPFIAGVADEVNKMPDETEAQRDAKMVANVKKLRTFKRKARR